MKNKNAVRFEINFVESLENALKKNWNLLAVSDFGGGNRYTYGECARLFIVLHKYFSEKKIKKGDKVAVLGRNSANWAVVYLATVSYGAVIVPILPDFHKDDVVHLLNHSESKLLFVQPSLFDGIETDRFLHTETAVSLKDWETLWDKKNKDIDIKNIEKNIKLEEKDFTLPKINNEEIASIVYTSGTSGFSKGVCLSYANLMSNIKYAQDTMPLYPGETILSFLPVAHCFGCAFEFLFPFFTGCHINFLSKIPTPSILVEAFAKVRPSLILSVPLIIEKMYYKKIKPAINKPHIKALMRLPLVKSKIKRKIRNQLIETFGGKFREIVIGGAAFSQEVESFLRSIEFPFTVGYGMTECGPLISYSPWKTYAPGSCGRAVDRMEIKLRSLNDGSHSGEILVRGANVMKGYYKNPEATREAIDDEGWLHTGDVGFMDKEGNLYINGRIKNMILGPSGQNIYPEEIEAKLNVLPYVQESLVVYRNGKIVALVYPDMERVDKEKISESDLIKIMNDNLIALNEKLPAYSKVSEIKIMPEEFQKTPKRSIKRFLYE